MRIQLWGFCATDAPLHGALKDPPTRGGVAEAPQPQQNSPVGERSLLVAAYGAGAHAMVGISAACIAAAAAAATTFSLPVIVEAS
jgi:hypothetical protein